MDDRIKGLLFGSLIGDAITLCAHWIYNPSKIQRLYKRVTDYHPPIAESYHSTKQRGDFTHYGDQTMVLFESVCVHKRFDLKDFLKQWQELFLDYSGYVDGATKATLDNIKKGVALDQIGSASNDLSGAARIAPLFLLGSASNFGSLYDSAKSQTSMTHNDPFVVDAAEYFARVVSAILAGSPVIKALDDASEFTYDHLPAKEWIHLARSRMDDTPPEAIKELGQTCHVADAFPATIYLLLKYPEDLENCLIENVMAGGDSAARGLILGMVMGARKGYENIPDRWIHGLKATKKITSLLQQFFPELSSEKVPSGSRKISFLSAEGHSLDARLEMPGERPRAYALFAHCFTCSKEIIAASRISRSLSSRGIAILRFDFTGLGNSQGDFANTNFSTNLQDLVAAANFLREHYAAPTLLVGHSLGGSAVLAACEQIPEVKGVVTVGAPSDLLHVAHLFKDTVPEIDSQGCATVTLSGRSFTIKKQFLDDLREHKLLEILKKNRKASLIMHSPTDQTVSIDHARKIFEALHHPKSFISLHPADHLLTKTNDAEYVAEVIAAWSSRLILT